MPRQACYWIVTLSCSVSPLQPSISQSAVYIKGQKEIGQSGFEHWQFIVVLNPKGSIRTIQGLFPGCHAEPTRSVAAESYVWKEDTRVADSQFELGTRPFKRNSKPDWDSIWEHAKLGNIMEIPANVRIQNYRTIRAICSDYAEPVPILRSCHVFVGGTGTGKSRRAWEEAGSTAYPKDPRSKFWCGYSGQRSVIIDEFRGGIDVSHLLRWLDRYPVIVEIKGSSVVLNATTIWITSNMPMIEWYPSLDNATFEALVRRVSLVQF